MVDDTTRELGTVLSYLLGRQLSAVEIARALGVSRSAYYSARDEGRLITADNLLRLAAAFGLNPVDLLVRYRLVDEDEVVEYTANRGEVPAAVVATATATRRAGGRRLRPRLDLPPV